MKEKLDATAKDLEEKQEELESAKRDLSKTESDLSTLQNETSSLKADISKLENERKDLENKLQAERKDSGYWESKASEFETDLQAERKKVERMRVAHDKDVKNKEAELATLKGKVKILEQSSGAGIKKIADLKQEYEEKTKSKLNSKHSFQLFWFKWKNTCLTIFFLNLVLGLEHSLAVEKAEYEELTGKYEILEEEHVVTKARLTVEKEAAQGYVIAFLMYLPI